MIRPSSLVLLVSLLSLVGCASSKPAQAPPEKVAETSTADEPAKKEDISGVQPGDDWLFWAEGDVLLVDGEVWWTKDDLNEQLAKSPPQVPERAREMDFETARPVVNSFVAASIRVKANKALVDWYLDRRGIEADDEAAKKWFGHVSTLVAGPEERRLLARFSGRDAPLVNEAGMRRAAARNARLATLMLEEGIEPMTREESKKLYESDPDAWQVPGMWTVRIAECESVEACRQFRERLVETPDQFVTAAEESGGYRGEVTFRAQAGTPARPLLNSFESREPGTLSPVVELGGAVWLAQLVEVESPHVPEFDDIAPTILASQHIGALNQFEDHLVARLLSNHDVEIVWDNVRFRVGDDIATLQPPRNSSSREDSK